MTESPEPTTERPGTPRWVIALGVGLLVLILLALVAIALSGGQHGPGMHSAFVGMFGDAGT